MNLYVLKWFLQYQKSLPVSSSFSLVLSLAVSLASSCMISDAMTVSISSAVYPCLVSQEICVLGYFLKKSNAAC